ncbi:MAG: hypothetical protein ACRYFW_03895 [Janthinobacterium lividum]
MRLALATIETRAQSRERPAEPAADGRLGEFTARQARVHRRQCLVALGRALENVRGQRAGMQQARRQRQQAAGQRRAMGVGGLRVARARPIAGDLPEAALAQQEARCLERGERARRRPSAITLVR